MHCTRLLLLIVLSLSTVGLVSTGPVQAENWPGWRGPRGDGTSSETGVPTVWDGAKGENIAWKVAIPGNGHASPAVWEDSIFIATCIAETKERVLLCLDRTNGSTRWQKTVVTSPFETKHGLNSYASSTPATDGKLVYVTFLETDGAVVPATNVGTPRPVNIGKMVVAAYDLQGEQKWIVRPGEFVSVHGYCSPPVIVDDLLIVNGDHDGNSYIVALNKLTGATAWKQPRQNKTRSYVTPLVREIGGRRQMVFSGNRCIVSLDPLTGKPLWTIDGPTEQFVASMVYDGKYFFMAAGFPTYHVMAIRPDGTGNVTKTHIAWESESAKCYVPSPVLAGGYLFVADDRGTGNCFDPATGKRLWQERLGSHFSSSLVTAGGLVYFLADDGVMQVVKPGNELEVVSRNKLGEQIFSSPAISHGQLFLRGETHLYAIGKSAGVATK